MSEVYDQARDDRLDDLVTELQLSRSLIAMDDLQLQRVIRISFRILQDRKPGPAPKPEPRTGLIVALLASVLICILIGMLIRPLADAAIAPWVNFLLGGGS